METVDITPDWTNPALRCVVVNGSINRIRHALTKVRRHREIDFPGAYQNIEADVTATFKEIMETARDVVAMIEAGKTAA